METKKNYQSPEVQVHRVMVESHLLDGSQTGPSADFIQDPGVGETDNE